MVASLVSPGQGQLEITKICSSIAFALRRLRKLPTSTTAGNRRSVAADGLVASLQLLEELVVRPTPPPFARRGGIQQLVSLARRGSAEPKLPHQRGPAEVQPSTSPSLQQATEQDESPSLQPKQDNDSLHQSQSEEDELLKLLTH